MRTNTSEFKAPAIIDAENWRMYNDNSSSQDSWNEEEREGCIIGNVDSSSQDSCYEEERVGWKIYNANSSGNEEKKRSRWFVHNKSTKTFLSSFIKVMAIWTLTSIVMLLIFNITVIEYLGQETLKSIVVISPFVIFIMMFLEKGSKKYLWPAVNAFFAWLITSSMISIILPKIFGLKRGVLNVSDVLKVLLAVLAIISVRFVKYKTRRGILLTMLVIDLLLSIAVIADNATIPTLICMGFACISICWEYKKCDTYKKKHPFG